ncbi:MAG: hypothetical protein R2713_19230 [Ilumatobacteraceae bacterium]
MAAHGRHPCGLQPRHPATDDGDVGRGARGHVPVGVARLVPGARFDDAGDDRVAGVAHLAGLVAADARPHTVGEAVPETLHEVGVGELGAGHLDAVGDAVADRPFGLAGVDDRALQEHRCARQCLADAAREFDVEPGRLVVIGTCLLGGEDRATHHHDVVDAGCDQHGCELHGDVPGVMPAHGASSRRDEPQATGKSPTASAPLRSPGGEQGAHLAPLVAPGDW